MDLFGLLITHVEFLKHLRSRIQNNENAELAIIHDRDIIRWQDDYFNQNPYESWIIQEVEASGNKSEL